MKIRIQDEKEMFMPSREEVLTLLKKHHPRLAAEYGVSRIGLFGS